MLAAHLHRPLRTGAGTFSRSPSGSPRPPPIVLRQRWAGGETCILYGSFSQDGVARVVGCGVVPSGMRRHLCVLRLTLRETFYFTRRWKTGFTQRRRGAESLGVGLFVELLGADGARGDWAASRGVLLIFAPLRLCVKRLFFPSPRLRVRGAGGSVTSILHPSNRSFTTLPSCVRRMAVPISSSSTGLPASLSQKAERKL